MSDMKISTKQQQILDYIKEEILKKGYPPAVREICEAVGLKSTSTVHAHLESLEKKGFIRRDPTKPRAIEIVDDSFQQVRTEMISIPVVGRVAAGEPILAEQNIEDSFPLPARYLGRGTSFMLRVHGDSMIEAGIDDGDMIIIDADKEPSIGDKVVALDQNNDSTLKTLLYDEEQARFYLHPENHTMEDIYVDELTVQGVVRFIVKKG